MRDVTSALGSARWLERAVEGVLSAENQDGALSAVVDACSALPCERLWIGFYPEGDKVPVTLASWSRDGSPVPPPDVSRIKPSESDTPGRPTLFPLARPAGATPGFLALYEARLDEIQAAHVTVLVRVLSTLLEPGVGAFARRAAELESRVAELERGNRTLLDLSRMKAEFLAGVSHQLRSPLTAVLGFSEVLRDELYGTLNDRQKEYVGHILDSGKLLLEQINDVMDLSRLEAGRMELELGDAYPGQIVETAVMLARERAVRQGVVLEWRIDDQAELAIRADSRKLRQAVHLLLAAAVKATRSGGNVRCGVALDAPDICIRISGTGGEMAAQELAAMARDLWRVDIRPSRSFQFLGLGLALANRIVELHGGSLRIEPTPDGGFDFLVRVPGRAGD